MVAMHLSKVCANVYDADTNPGHFHNSGGWLPALIMSSIGRIAGVVNMRSRAKYGPAVPVWPRRSCPTRPDASAGARRRRW